MLEPEDHAEKRELRTNSGTNPSKPIVEQLAEWNEIAVIAGLRSLHAEIRAEGESPRLLDALARGYANLGVMTERLWSPAPQGL